MLIRGEDEPSVYAAKRLRVPTAMAIASLPIVLVVVQLASSLVHKGVLGLAGPTHGPLATLAGMATGSVSLLLIAGGVPLALSLSLPRALGLRTVQPSVAAWAVVGTVSLSPLADILMATMARFFPEQTLGSIPMLHDLAQQFPLWAIWPVFALLPGLAEEAFFRGYFLRAFANVQLGVVVSGVCFAFFHLDPHHIVGVLPLGLFLSWVAARHGVWVSVAAHVANNSLALLSIHVPDLDVGYGTDHPMPAYWVPLGLCVTIVAIFRLKQGAQTDGAPST